MSNTDNNIPDWLTKDFLKKLIKDNQNVSETEINITHYEVDNFISKGNNYTSIILRINIEYETDLNGHTTNEEATLIAKVPLKEGPLISVFQTGVLETEIEAYKELLPKLNDIIKQENPEDDFIPKMFKTDIGNTMILEDLNASGYKMAEKKHQLDYDHGVLTIKSLAKFHAASVKLQENDPELIEKFKTDAIFIRNMNDDVRNAINSMIGEDLLEIVIQEFDQRPETRKYVDFLTKLKHKFWDVYLGAIIPSDGEFRLLNHGDLWTNNILYKYDHSSKPQTLKFLDFQLLRSTSPTVDLLNFLHTSIRFDVLNRHFNDFMKIYLDHLNLNLEKYGCTQRLDEVEFNRSLEKREIFSLLLCIVGLPYMQAEPDDLNETSDNDKSIQTFPVVKLVQNKNYKTICLKYLDEYSKRDSFKNFK